MLFTNAINSTTTITIYWIVIATIKKNNANLLLLVGSTMTSSTLGNRLYTNYNIDV